VVNAKAGIIMDNAYSYDAVSNVLGIKNNAPLPQSGKAGGQMSHSYTYDPLYRLASATGTYKGTDNKSASYTLSMGYDNMHRITSKKQHLSQTGVQFEGTLNAGYELTYTYQKADGKKFQLDNVRDINYRTEETPTDSTNINNGHKYTYDLNGNLVYINTSRVKKDGKEDEKASEQKYRWDEENRLLAVDENGFVSNYWYDADGERTVKTSGENEAIYVNYRASRVQCQVCLSIAEAQPIITESNSEFSGGNTGTARFSLYVSPYLVAGQGGKYTKHIYIGSQRIVSKLGDLASYGADPRRIPYAGNEADGLTINYKDKYARQLQSIKDNYKAFDQPYNGKDNDDYVNGQGFCCNDATPEAAQARTMNASTRSAVDNNFHDKDNYEKMQFYYHPDHLGSSSYITNLDGEVSQHIEYVPFGEVFIEERNNTWNTPYLFNAKEFDEETGMYYYGARYMDPQNSMWLGVDPLTEKYPNLTGYCYTNNNPVKYIDPTGTDWYRNDETAAIFWQEGNANSITYDGQKYRNIGETYSIYQSGMRYDYQQDKIIKVSDASGRFNVEGGQYIPKSFITDDGTKVSVTFKYKSPTGGYGDYALSKDAVSLLIKGINDANISGAGITSIDVSTTTTGKHSPSSNHYASNGGRAIDIDMVNGISVKNPKSHEKVDAFQRAIRKNPILRENFGPNIQEKEGKTKRISGHNNHIHIATQKR